MTTGGRWSSRRGMAAPSMPASIRALRSVVGCPRSASITCISRMRGLTLIGRSGKHRCADRRRCDAPTVPGAVASSGRENFSERGRGGSDELGEGHGLPSSLGPTDDSRSQGAWDGCETRGWSSRARSSRVPSLRAFSLVEGSGGGARPGVDATRVSAGSRSAVELVEACFEAPYGAVDIGELVEAEESDAE